VNLLVTLKGLPMSYNRDLQEDKPALFDAADTLRSCVTVVTELLRNVSLNGKNIHRSLDKNFMLATDVADYLVARGVPFREAHRAAGRLVRYCQDRGRTFATLSVNEFKAVDSRFGADIGDVLDYRRSVDRKISPGGTALKNVRGLIAKLRRSAG
jgi:argininosuccinate lyase